MLLELVLLSLVDLEKKEMQNLLEDELEKNVELDQD